MIHSIRFKIAASFLVLVLGAIALVAYFASRQTTEHFEGYLRQGAGFYGARTAGSLAQFYAQKGSWEGVGPFLTDLRRSSADRLALADERGIVLADTAEAAVGQSAVALGLTGGQSVAVDGRTVGTLYVLTEQAGGGSGRGIGQGPGRGGGQPGSQGGPSSSTIVTAEERAGSDFLDAMRRSLLSVGLIAGGVTLVITLFLTSTFVAPLRELRDKARLLGAGDLGQRARVRSQDEVGELAEAFNAMAEKLETTERSRRNIIADIAHELRTPLTVIEGTVDALADGVFAPTPERLNLLKQQSGALNKLISDLRELSLLEAGQLRLELADLSLAREVSETVETFQARAREAGIALRASCPPGLAVRADAARLRQVLNNLLDNALRYTPSGGAVDVTAEAQPDGLAHVRMRDSGPGIPREQLERVFERFYRLDPSRAKREGGTGLGLAIVKALVEAQGGRIWAQSAPGAGATFTFTLPRASSAHIAPGPGR